MEHEAKISPLFFPSIFVNFWRNTSIKFCGILITFHEWSYYPANICLDEDVLIKTNMFALALLLQKTSSRRLQDVLVRTNIFVLAIRLQDVLKKVSRRLQDVLQDIFKKSSRCFEDVLENVFKTFSRRLQDVLQRYLQDVCKTYYQVKLFLLTRL